MSELLELSEDSRMLLKGGIIWSEQGKDWVQGHVDIAIDGGFITRVHSASVGFKESTPEFDRRTVIDLGGQWLLPGLTDAHCHLTGLSPNMQLEASLAVWADVCLLRAARRARQILGVGVTTVRDPGSSNGLTLRNAQLRRIVEAPRVISAGPALTATAGGGDNCDLPVPSTAEESRGVVVVDGVQPLRRAIRRLNRRKVDCVSVIVNYSCRGGGVSHSWTGASDYDSDELDVVRSEAERHYLPIGASASGARAVLDAIRGGARVIEHGLSAPDREMFECLVEHNVVLVPTLARYEHLAKVNPGGDSRVGSLSHAEVFEQQMEMVGAARTYGVKVAVGSDDDCTTDYALFREMELLAEMGFEWHEIVGATITPTGLSANTGRKSLRLTEGAPADLVAFSADPHRVQFSQWPGITKLVMKALPPVPLVLGIG